MSSSSVADRSEENGDVPRETWRVPQCPFLIECSSEVLDQIRLEVEAGVHSQRIEREIGGVLFGRNEPGRVAIVACRALLCEHAMGPGFVLSERDEKRLAELIAAAPVSGELNGLAAVGWYHSHIHSKIFLSERDLQIHTRYFPAPFQVALVLRPSRENPLRAGYFFRESTGAIRADSSYQEFTVQSPPEPEVRQADETGARRPSKPAPASSGRKPPEPAQPLCPKCGGKRIRRSHRTATDRIWGVFGLQPYRCEECLSRSLRRTSAGLLEAAHAHSRKRPEERKRAWLHTRRQILLYGGGILGFLLFLFYLIRDTGPKQDQP